MRLIVNRTHALQGRIIPPSSKSQTIRGMIFSLLANGNSILENALDSDDAEVARQVCSDLGAKITHRKHSCHVTSLGLPLHITKRSIFTGNSGITTRFILPILGLCQENTPIVLDCGEQMRARPIASLVQALRQLGLNIRYLKEEGKLPVEVSGSLKGGQAEVDGITSQYISALLIALPCAEHDSQIIVKNLNERPYMEMTLHWLKSQKILFIHEKNRDHDLFTIKGQQRYQPFSTRIAGDFSSASYLIAAGVMLPGEVVIEGLDMQDPQGDKRLISILRDMGADIRIELNHLYIRGGLPLFGKTIDLNDIPDLLPTLASVATMAEGETTLHNVPQARLKETDRIHSMTEGLTRMGATVHAFADGMQIKKSALSAAHLNGYDDHRTIMALSLAGMIAEGATEIDGASAIDKTFPHYVSVMQSLGARMEINAG